MKKPFFIIKTISWVLLCAFLVQDLSWAQGGAAPTGGQAPVWATSKDAARPDFAWNIPKALGLSQAPHITNSGETIIQIQDAHDSLEAQKKIVDILNVLSVDYDVKSVALEGSSGAIDASLFKSYPNQEVAKAAAEDLVAQGRLNAGELFSILSKEPVSVYGVEKKTLYRQNLRAFRDLLRQKESLSAKLQGLNRTLEVLSERLDSVTVRDLYQNGALSSEENIQFTNKWNYFQKLAQKKHIRFHSYPNLRTLARVTRLEKHIEFSAANLERDSLLRRLRQKLRTADQEELVSKSLAFKSGKLVESEFYLYLSELARKNGIAASDYPNLSRYVHYLLRFDTIDLAKIFDELSHYEENILNAYFTSSEEKLLFILKKKADILTALLSGNATSKQFDDYRLHKKQFTAARFSQPLQKLARRYHVPFYGGLRLDELEKGFFYAERFYSLAEKRNNVMIENTLAKMRREGKRVAALVTGGFHTKGISNILKEDQLSYLVVLPKITDPNKKRPYITIITRKKQEFQKELSSPASRYTIAIGSLMDAGNAYYNREQVLELIQLFIEDIRKSPDPQKLLQTWMQEYRKTYFSRAERNYSLHPEKIEAILAAAIGKETSKTQKASAARLAQSSALVDRSNLFVAQFLPEGTQIQNVISVDIQPKDLTDASFAEKIKQADVIRLHFSKDSNLEFLLELLRSKITYSAFKEEAILAFIIPFETVGAFRQQRRENEFWKKFGTAHVMNLYADAESSDFHQIFVYKIPKSKISEANGEPVWRGARLAARHSRQEFGVEFGTETQTLLDFLGIFNLDQIQSYTRSTKGSLPERIGQKDLRRYVFEYKLQLKNGETVRFFTKKYLGNGGGDQSAVVSKLQNESNLNNQAASLDLAPHSILIGTDQNPVLVNQEASGESLIKSAALNREIVSALGSALGQLHRLGIVHTELTTYATGNQVRLLRKDHIFVENKNGQIKVRFIDFGLSKRSNNHQMDLERRNVQRSLDPQFAAAFRAGYEQGLKELTTHQIILQEPTPITEFYNLFELDKAELVDSNEIGKLSVYTFETAALDTISTIPAGASLLRELINRTDWPKLNGKPFRWDVVFYKEIKSNGQVVQNIPIAIVPKIDQQLHPAQNYFDLTDFMVPYSLLRRLGDHNAKSKWEQSARKQRDLRQQLEDYFAQLSREYRVNFIPANSRDPFILVEAVERDSDLDVHISAFDLNMFLGELHPDRLERLSHILFNEPPAPNKAILMIWPTVYQPADTRSTDDVYRSNVYQLLKQYSFQDGDAVLDDAAGSGISAWLNWLATRDYLKRPILFAKDINPIAVANADANLNKLLGLNVSVKSGGELILAGNKPLFDRPMQVITSNSPSMGSTSEINMADLIGGRKLASFHDSGASGIEFWVRQIKAFQDPRVLDSERGLGVLWNIKTLTRRDPVLDLIRQSQITGSVQSFNTASRSSSSAAVTYVIASGNSDWQRLVQKMSVELKDIPGEVYSLGTRLAHVLKDVRRVNQRFRHLKWLRGVTFGSSTKRNSLVIRNFRDLVRLIPSQWPINFNVEILANTPNHIVLGIKDYANNGLIINLRRLRAGSATVVLGVGSPHYSNQINRYRIHRVLRQWLSRDLDKWLLRRGFNRIMVDVIPGRRRNAERFFNRFGYVPFGNKSDRLEKRLYPPHEVIPKLRKVSELWKPENLKKYGALRVLIHEYRHTLGMRHLIPRMMAVYSPSQTSNAFREFAGELFAADRLRRDLQEKYDVKILALGVYIGQSEIDILAEIKPKSGVVDTELEPGLYFIEAKEFNGYPNTLIRQTVQSQATEQARNAALLKKAGVPVQGIIVAVGGNNGNHHPLGDFRRERTVDGIPIYSTRQSSFDVEADAGVDVPEPSEQLIYQWARQELGIISLFKQLFNPTFQVWSHPNLDTEGAARALRRLQQIEARQIKRSYRNVYKEKKSKEVQLKNLEKRYQERDGWIRSFERAGIQDQELENALHWYFIGQSNIPLADLRSNLQAEWNREIERVSWTGRIKREVYFAWRRHLNNPIRRFILNSFRQLIGGPSLMTIENPDRARLWVISKWKRNFSLNGEEKILSLLKTDRSPRERYQNEVDGWILSFAGRVKLTTQSDGTLSEGDVRKVLESYFKPIIDGTSKASDLRRVLQDKVKEGRQTAWDWLKAQHDAHVMDREVAGARFAEIRPADTEKVKEWMNQLNQLIDSILSGDSPAKSEAINKHLRKAKRSLTYEKTQLQQQRAVLRFLVAQNHFQNAKAALRLRFDDIRLSKNPKLSAEEMHNQDPSFKSLESNLDHCINLLAEVLRECDMHIVLRTPDVMIPPGERSEGGRLASPSSEPTPNGRQGLTARKLREHLSEREEQEYKRIMNIRSHWFFRLFIRPVIHFIIRFKWARYEQDYLQKMVRREFEGKEKLKQLHKRKQSYILAANHVTDASDASFVIALFDKEFRKIPVFVANMRALRGIVRWIAKWGAAIPILEDHDTPRRVQQELAHRGAIAGMFITSHPVEKLSLALARMKDTAIKTSLLTGKPIVPCYITSNMPKQMRIDGLEEESKQLNGQLEPPYFIRVVIGEPIYPQVNPGQKKSQLKTLEDLKAEYIEAMMKLGGLDNSAARFALSGVGGLADGESQESERVTKRQTSWAWQLLKLIQKVKELPFKSKSAPRQAQSYLELIDQKIDAMPNGRKNVFDKIEKFIVLLEIPAWTLRVLGVGGSVVFAFIHPGLAAIGASAAFIGPFSLVRSLVLFFIKFSSIALPSLRGIVTFPAIAVSFIPIVGGWSALFMMVSNASGVRFLDSLYLMDIAEERVSEAANRVADKKLAALMNNHAYEIAEKIMLYQKNNLVRTEASSLSLAANKFIYLTILSLRLFLRIFWIKTRDYLGDSGSKFRIRIAKLSTSEPFVKKSSSTEIHFTHINLDETYRELLLGKSFLYLDSPENIDKARGEILQAFEVVWPSEHQIEMSQLKEDYLGRFYYFDFESFQAMVNREPVSNPVFIKPLFVEGARLAVLEPRKEVGVLITKPVYLFCYGLRLHIRRSTKNPKALRIGVGEFEENLPSDYKLKDPSTGKLLVQFQFNPEKLNNQPRLIIRNFGDQDIKISNKPIQAARLAEENSKWASIAPLLGIQLRAWLDGVGGTRFILREGMQHGSKFTWWHNLRSKTRFDNHGEEEHFGTDLVLFEDTEGMIHTLKPKSPNTEGNSVPALLTGHVKWVLDDKVQKTIIIETSVTWPDGQEVSLLTTYMHLTLDREFKPGDPIEAGTILGQVSRSKNLEAVVSSHAHTAFSYINPDKAAELIDSPDDRDLNQLLAQGVLVPVDIQEILGHALYSELFKFQQESEIQLKEIIVYSKDKASRGRMRGKIRRVFPGLPNVTTSEDLSGFSGDIGIYQNDDETWTIKIHQENWLEAVPTNIVPFVLKNLESIRWRNANDAGARLAEKGLTAQWVIKTTQQIKNLAESIRAKQKKVLEKYNKIRSDVEIPDSFLLSLNTDTPEKLEGELNENYSTWIELQSVLKVFQENTLTALRSRVAAGLSLQRKRPISGRGNIKSNTEAQPLYQNLKALDQETKDFIAYYTKTKQRILENISVLRLSGYLGLEAEHSLLLEEIRRMFPLWKQTLGKFSDEKRMKKEFVNLLTYHLNDFVKRNNWSPIPKRMMQPIVSELFDLLYPEIAGELFLPDILTGHLSEFRQHFVRVIGAPTQSSISKVDRPQIQTDLAQLAHDLAILKESSEAKPEAKELYNQGLQFMLDYKLIELFGDVADQKIHLEILKDLFAASNNLHTKIRILTTYIRILWRLRADRRLSHFEATESIRTLINWVKNHPLDGSLKHEQWFLEEYLIEIKDYLLNHSSRFSTFFKFKDRLGNDRTETFSYLHALKWARRDLEGTDDSGQKGHLAQPDTRNKSTIVRFFRDEGNRAITREIFNEFHEPSIKYLKEEGARMANAGLKFKRRPFLQLVFSLAFGLLTNFRSFGQGTTFQSVFPKKRSPYFWRDKVRNQSNFGLSVHSGRFENELRLSLGFGLDPEKRRRSELFLRLTNIKQDSVLTFNNAVQGLSEEQAKGLLPAIKKLIYSNQSDIAARKPFVAVYDRLITQASRDWTGLDRFIASLNPQQVADLLNVTSDTPSKAAERRVLDDLEAGDRLLTSRLRNTGFLLDESDKRFFSHEMPGRITDKQRKHRSELIALEQDLLAEIQILHRIRAVAQTETSAARLASRIYTGRPSTQDRIKELMVEIKLDLDSWKTPKEMMKDDFVDFNFATQKSAMISNLQRLRTAYGQGKVADCVKYLNNLLSGVNSAIDYIVSGLDSERAKSYRENSTGATLRKKIEMLKGLLSANGSRLDGLVAYAIQTEINNIRDKLEFYDQLNFLNKLLFWLPIFVRQIYLKQRLRQLLEAAQQIEIRSLDQRWGARLALGSKDPLAGSRKLEVRSESLLQTSSFKRQVEKGARLSLQDFGEQLRRWNNNSRLFNSVTVLVDHENYRNTLVNEIESYLDGSSVKVLEFENQSEALNHFQKQDTSNQVILLDIENIEILNRVSTETVVLLVSNLSEEGTLEKLKAINISPGNSHPNLFVLLRKNSNLEIDKLHEFLDTVFPIGARLAKDHIRLPGGRVVRLPKASETIQHYDEFDQQGRKGGLVISWVLAYPEIRGHILKFIREHVGQRLRILSLGSGRGQLEVDLISEGNEVVGIELSPKNAEFSRQKNVPTIEGNVHELSALAKRNEELKKPFDVILLSESIGHMNPDKVFGQLSGLLKPQGVILLTQYIESDSDSKNTRYIGYSSDDLLKLLRRNGYIADIAAVIEATANGIQKPVGLNLILARKSGARLGQAQEEGLSREKLEKLISKNLRQLNHIKSDLRGLSARSSRYDLLYQQYLKIQSELKELRERLDKLSSQDIDSKGARLADGRKNSTILIGVSNSQVQTEVKKIIGDREDVRIQIVSSPDREEQIQFLEDHSEGAKFTLFIDDEDLNAEAKREFLSHLNDADFKANPDFLALLNGEKQFSGLAKDEQERLSSLLFKLLPAISKKTIEDLQVEGTRPERALELLRLNLFHPSFGYQFGDIFANVSANAPRAAIWTEADLKEPGFLEALDDRDVKLKGRMVIDDYIQISPETDLHSLLGEQYEAFVQRFTDNRILKTTDSSIERLYQHIQTSTIYKKENVLFIDRFSNRYFEQEQDSGLNILVLKGEHALTLDKVVAEILARSGRTENLFIKGLEIHGRVFYFTPVAPIDFVKLISGARAAKQATLQSA